MKIFKFILVSLICLSSTIFWGQTILVGNLSTAMSKNEAKLEITSNKALYKDLSIGSYRYKLYHQNNGFDSNGKLNSVKLNPSGGVLGLDKITSRLLYEDLINFFIFKGFSSRLSTQNPIEFEVGKVVTLESEVDERTIQIAVIPYGDKYILNLVIGRFEKSSTEHYKDLEGDF
jgi:hypothetical protein